VDERASIRLALIAGAAGGKARLKRAAPAQDGVVGLSTANQRDLLKPTVTTC
jgi:hypothetical protein